MRVRWNGIDAPRRSSTMSGTSGGAKIERKQEGRNTSPRADLYRSVFPIYYLGKTCGLIPVRFFVNASGKCEARLNIVDLAYSFSVLIVLLTAGIWGLWRDLKDGWEHSTRLKSRTAVIATCSDILGVIGLTVVCIVASPFRWKYLRVVINILIEVNERVGGVSSAKKSRRFTIILSVCILAYLCFNSCLDFYSWSRKTKGNGTMTGKGPVNYAPLYFMYTVIITTEIQYTVSTYNIGQGFVKLNSNLEDLLAWALGKDEDYFGEYSWRKAASFGQRSSSNALLREQFQLESSGICGKLYAEGRMQANRISELIAVHSSLCDAISLVNDTFGVVMLTVTVTCLLHLVITPYFLILQAGEKHEWLFLVVQGMWCVFHVTRMMMIVQPSYFAIAEGKRTAILVSRLLSSSSSFDANTRRELEIFSLQVLHRPLEFSACGLFSLDRTLITSIAGVVTTYLVILIQFQNADDTKGEVDIIKNTTEMLKNITRFR